MAEAFQVMRLYKRLVEKRHITEEGAFAEGQVPTDYGGAELQVEIVQRLIFTDPAGHLIELRMDNLTGVMDKTRQTGVGVTVPVIYGTGDPTVVAPTGPSAHSVTWTVETNAALSESELGKADQMYSLYLGQGSV